MTWAAELLRLRRTLRDPNGNIWDSDVLADLWNEVQHDLQRKTSILEDVRAISVPPRYHASYTYDWESAFAFDTVHYHCLRPQQNYFTVCFWWEVIEFVAGESDFSDEGVAVTHPFEAWEDTAQHPPIFPFPSNLNEVKGLYYDREPIYGKRKKDIALVDPSWHKREGEPVCYVREDMTSNQFWLYPKPSTIVWNDSTGDGNPTSVSGDTTNDELGTITKRTGSLITNALGVAIEIIDADDNLLLVYKIAPTEVASSGDAVDFPKWMRKYVRYGVLQRALLMNNDGRAPSLSFYWRRRYELGVQVLERYMAGRRRDRDYRLRDTGVPARRTRKHPRLPDGYPAV